MKKIILTIFAVLILVIAVLFFTLRINTVSVKGNERYTSKEIEEIILNNNWNRLSTVQFFRKLAGQRVQIPFVEKYDIIFRSPTEIQIIVYEKTIVGYVRYMSSFMYFDKDGIVSESSEKKLEDVPEIKGLDFGSIVLYKKLPVSDEKIFDKILSLTQNLSVKKIKVSLIEFSGINRITLYLADEDIIAELGNDEELGGKIAELADILPKIKGKSGILYLDTYSEDISDPVYSFKTK